MILLWCTLLLKCQILNNVVRKLEFLAVDVCLFVLPPIFLLDHVLKVLQTLHYLLKR